MTERPASLAELRLRGAPALSHYLERAQPPSSAIEWLGIAVGALPALSAGARTADEVHPESRVQSVDLRAPLLDALADELAAATATIAAARDALSERYPAAAAEDGDPEGYADLFEAAHRESPRHAERMISAYAAFIAGAIETAGALADAEREHHDGAADARASQLYSALTTALGELLAYVRIVSADQSRLA
ncbi:MAG: hypothetical protein QOG63_2308 [Thermoleophilaceae bacterium]|nr:hypothetical protein [Thermoleophilaceae bacterium]